MRNHHLCRGFCYVAGRISYRIRDRIDAVVSFTRTLCAEAKRFIECSERRVLDVVNRIAVALPVILLVRDDRRQHDGCNIGAGPIRIHARSDRHHLVVRRVKHWLVDR